jgi:hypothetical protein
MNNMERKELILESKFRFVVDETVDDFDSFKEAMDGGAIKIIKTDINLSTTDGEVCNQEDTIDEIIQAIIYGLRERT